ncbi:hypothetical protein [Luteimonas suaedae]|uniref:hypothetical protein n=1 Tax=Luteimonas suaedae TaxID=2605430 RepID=UPI0011EBCAD3|nr:hypothetical protein [Luteimonas suaedae]
MRAMPRALCRHAIPRPPARLPVRGGTVDDRIGDARGIARMARSYEAAAQGCDIPQSGEALK